MADRMPRSLIANCAPSSLQLPLPLCSLQSGGSRNHPGTLWAIQQGDGDRCGHSLSNTRYWNQEESQSLLVSDVQLQTATLLQITRLPTHIYTPLCDGPYGQLQNDSGTNTSFEITRSQSDRSGTSSSICLRHQSHKAGLCSPVLHGLWWSLVFSYNKGQLKSLIQYTHQRNRKPAVSADKLQSSALTADPPQPWEWQSFFSQFWWSASMKALHSRGRILNHFMFTT